MSEEQIQSNATEMQDKTEITLQEFLESMPPSTESNISDLSFRPIGSASRILKLPAIDLYCPDEQCEGIRKFRALNKEISLNYKQKQCEFLYYRCDNCQKQLKTYAIIVYSSNAIVSSNINGIAVKVGEYPAFGPFTPSQLIKIIGPDKDLYIKGRRCESQGLGIAAFAYYRRVIENQRDRIFDKIINAMKNLGIEESVVKNMENCKNERQFTKSISEAKEFIPQALFIKGQNPLSLLHNALSKGIHNYSDEKCLEMAKSVRNIMGNLSERLHVISREEKDLIDSISFLLNIER
jgi:hypothetical protein